VARNGRAGTTRVRVGPVTIDGEEFARVFRTVMAETRVEERE
jgi:hypothetical protein